MHDKSVISTSKESQKRSIITEEKQGFEKFTSELKESVFQVLYLILKDEEEGLIGFFFETALDYLQNLAFAFYSKIYSVWKASQLLNVIFNIFNFFQLQTYFGSAFTYTNYVIAFYLIVTVIILVFINITYVSYAFSKKRVSAIWPVIVLRSVASLVFTLFFLPITELLIGMLQCQSASNGSGMYVLANYQTVECFKGSHIIHATVAIIITVLFAIVGFVVVLACFEVRMLTEDMTARQHSRGDVFFTVNKIILQLSFAFFTDQWMLVLALVVPALILWYTYNIGEPYYNKHCTAFFRVMTTYYLWTNSMVGISKLLENSTFTGGLITWLIGLPFIGAIMLTSSRSKTSSLVQTTSRFKTSEDLLEHLRFVLQLIDTYKTDKNASILLTGYIEKHKDTCEEDDCPLKTTKRRRLSTGGTNQLDETILGLTLVVDRMYQIGIKKFKASVPLRLAYCVFLIERMKKTKKAEQELARARELNPGFVDQFTIFRLTKLLNDGLEGVDVVGLIAWENYKNLYNEYIRESANLHKEFWLELKEDKPDLLKLNYLGSKVNNAMTYAKDYWTRLQKINADESLILRTYGRFLIDIQNDDVEGYDLLQKARKLLSKKIYYQIARKNSFDAGIDQYPYVEVIGNGNDMGKIKNANLLFTILVGVNRDEIIDKKINNFMPDIFSQYHDTFFKNYNSRDEDVDIKYLDNDNELFVKSRSGYIIPVVLRVTRLRTEEASNQVIFGAWLRNEFLKKSYVYFICQPDGIIMDMTATAVTVLNLNITQVRKTRMNIDSIVPGALSEKGFRERGKEVLFRTDSNSTPGIHLNAMVLPIQLRDNNNIDFKDLYQNQNPGKPMLSSVENVYGYIIKVEKIEKHIETHMSGTGDLSRHLSEKGTSGGNRRPSNLLELDQSVASKGALKSDRERGEAKANAGNDGQIIYGFNTDYADLEITELFQNDGMKLDFENLMKGDIKEERKRVHYGIDITHKKYIGGRLFEFTEDLQEEQSVRIKQWEENEEDEESLFLKEDDDLHALDTKKRKDKLGALKRLVKDAMETNSRTTAISTLKSVTCLWVASIITIGVLQFVFLNDLFSDYEDKLHVLKSHSDKIAEISKINTVITDFLTFNANPVLETSYTNANIDDRREQIKTGVNNIVTLLGDLSQEKYITYTKSITETIIPLIIYTATDTQTVEKTEPEAVFFITSRAYALHSKDISDFTFDNPEVKTVMYNYINSILPKQRTLALEFNNEMVKSLKSFELRFILLFIFNALVALFTSFWGVWALNNVEQQKADVLLLFLEIPPRNVEIIGKKRDKFMDFFETVSKQDPNNQIGDDSIDSDGSLDIQKTEGGHKGIFDSSLGNGALSAVDPNSSEEQEEALKNRKKLIKRYRSTNFQKTKDNIFKAFILIFLALICSASNSIQIFATKHNIRNYTVQFYTNILLSDTVLTTINMNRLMMVSPYISVNGINIKTAAYQALEELDGLGDNLKDFLLFITDKDNEIENPAKKLYNQNACTILTNSTEVTACEDSLNQALRLGFFNLKDQIFKMTVQQYDDFVSDSSATDDDYITMFQTNDDYKEFAYKIISEFNIYEESYLQKILSRATNLQEIILIVYILVVIILVIYFWLAFILKLNAEVWRTTRMITMIPLDIVNNIPSIKRFLKNLIRKSS
jgi:hypothetical protein